MTVQDIVASGSGALIILFTLVQISPIKINPWSAIFGWFGKQMNKDLSKDVGKIQTEIDNLKTELKSMKAENEERYVKDCRCRILRFSDEIYLGQSHSKEHYKQILIDITTYDRYCVEHPQFENQIAVAAIDQIKTSYSELLNNHKFLQ